MIKKKRILGCQSLRRLKEQDSNKKYILKSLCDNIQHLILCGDLQRNIRNMRIQETNMRVLNICITQTYVSSMLAKC